MSVTNIARGPVISSYVPTPTISSSIDQPIITSTISNPFTNLNTNFSSLNDLYSQPKKEDQTSSLPKYQKRSSTEVSNDKPYKCNAKGCNKAFNRCDELSRHTKIHSGKREFKCKVCSRQFSRSDHLKTHER